MRTSAALAERIAQFLIGRVAERREPDLVVGAENPGGPYLRRWYLTPWRRWRDEAESAPTRWHRCKAGVARWLPNLYLHCFLRDDDDRALHDHPSWAASYILRGGYIEHTVANGGIHHRTAYRPGALRFLGTRHAHRIELFCVVFKRRAQGPTTFFMRDTLPLPRQQCWTLFMFGPTVRDWGFHCPHRGWVPWREFTAEGKPGEIGPGCDA